MGTLAKSKKISIKQLSILIAIALLLGAYFVYMSFAAATTMTVSPTSGTKPLGTNFVVDVRVNSDLEDINAVRSHLSFPAAKLTS